MTDPFYPRHASAPVTELFVSRKRITVGCPYEAEPNIDRCRGHEYALGQLLESATVHPLNRRCFP